MSNTSLFYGIPTYALIKLFGFSIFLLRIISAISAILSVLLAYYIGRKYFDRSIGVIVAVLFAFSAQIIFYGRYCGSPAGTLLSALIAVYFSFSLIDSLSYIRSIFCVLSLYILTLQYASGRIAAFILLAYITFTITIKLLQKTPKKVNATNTFKKHGIISLLFIYTFLGGVWLIQNRLGSGKYLFNVRKEQYFQIIKDERLAKRYIPEIVPQIDMNINNKLTILRSVIHRNASQYIKHLAPIIRNPKSFREGEREDLLYHLYFAPLFIFIVWGVLYSLIHYNYHNILFLILFIGYSAPLFFTTYIDSHRIFLLIIPILFWAAIGIREANYTFNAKIVPKQIIHIISITFLAISCIYNYQIFKHKYYKPQIANIMLKEISTINKPILIGGLYTHRSLMEIELLLLDRIHKNNKLKPVLSENETRLVYNCTVLTEQFLNDLKDQRSNAIESLEQLSDKAVILLAPAHYFSMPIKIIEEKRLKTKHIYSLDKNDAVIRIENQNQYK